MTDGSDIETHTVVSRDEWLAARKALLAKEKEFSRQRDAFTRMQRALPWEKVEKAYSFEGPRGRATLADLFDGRSQLVLYHFMFGPDWEAGCPHCSFWADNFDRVVVHLNQRDVTMVVVSRAPYEKLAAYQKRMGWSFTWMSSAGSDFNFDFNVSFSPEEMKNETATYNYRTGDVDSSEREGISVFYKNHENAVFHTYSTYARGIDMVNGAYHFLDLTPKGRDEPAGSTQFWVRRHDEYGS